MAALHAVVAAAVVPHVHALRAHQDDSVGHVDLEILGHAPADAAADDLAVAGRKHRGLLVVRADVRVVDVGDDGRPVLSKVPGRGDADAPAVLPAELRRLVALRRRKLEFDAVELGPVRPRNHGAEVPVLGDVPVDAGGDRLGDVEVRSRRTAENISRHAEIRVTLHARVDLRLVDRADGEVVEDLVASAELHTAGREAVVAVKVVANVPVLRIDVAQVRHRVRILLEVEVEKPRARTDRPVVGDAVGDVRVDDESLDRRLLRAPGHETIMGIARAEAVVGRDAKAECEAPKCRRDELHVGQDEEAGIHRRTLVGSAIPGNLDAAARVLGDEANLERDVGDVVQCRRVDCIGGAVKTLAKQRTAVGCADGRGLVKPETRRKCRCRRESSHCHCQQLFHMFSLLIRC